jgi:hypothetical protein
MKAADPPKRRHFPQHISQPSQNQYPCKQLHTYRLASSAASEASCSLVSAVPDRSSDRSRSSSMSCTFLFSAAISLSACNNVLTTSQLDDSKFRHLLRRKSFLTQAWILAEDSKTLPPSPDFHHFFLSLTLNGCGIKVNLLFKVNASLYKSGE